MTTISLKTIMLAAGMTLGVVTSTTASGLYWVVGNLVTNSCNIVSQHPVVSPEGPVWFGNGPHKSYDEAKQARQGISACPRSGEATR